MFLIGVPLLVVPFAIYNMVAFFMPELDWTKPLPPVHIVSGGDWAMSPGDILIVFAILILFFELVKSTRIGLRTIIDHMLSAVLFAVILVEFLLVKEAATATFFGTAIAINFLTRALF